jgi:hypothetical protein
MLWWDKSIQKVKICVIRTLLNINHSRIHSLSDFKMNMTCATHSIEDQPTTPIALTYTRNELVETDMKAQYRLRPLQRK